MSETVTAPKRRPPSPARTGDVDRVGLEVALDALGLFEVVHGVRFSRCLDGLDLLGSALRPTDGEVARQQVVAAEAVLDVDDVAGGTEVGDLVGEDELI